MKVADDFDFERRETEANEEFTAVAWAENNGWLVRKIQYVHRRSCPDRLFVGYGQLIMIEMKKPAARRKKGGGLSAGQAEEFLRFAERGVSVHVCYSAAEVIAILESKMPALI